MYEGQPASHGFVTSGNSGIFTCPRFSLRLILAEALSHFRIWIIYFRNFYKSSILIFLSFGIYFQVRAYYVGFEILNRSEWSQKSLETDVSFVKWPDIFIPVGVLLYLFYSQYVFNCSFSEVNRFFNHLNIAVDKTEFLL